MVIDVGILWLLLWVWSAVASDVVSWWGHSTALIGDTVWVEGGLLTEGSMSPDGTVHNPTTADASYGLLYALDLGRSVTSTNFSSQLLRVATANTNPDIPVYIGAAALSNDKGFFVYG